MEKIIRIALVEDYDETENITREAFRDVYIPGCVEHLILHNMRKSS